MPAHTFCRFFAAASMVGCLILPAPNNSWGAVIDWTGDTVISDVRTYTADNITIQGNLTITGKLTLVGTDLRMDCPSCGTYAIDVKDGGAISILAGSKVHASNPDAHYLFRVWPGSALTMNDSELHDCGWGGNYTIPASDRGLYVNASIVSLTNSTISANYLGIIIDNSSSALVSRNNVSANEAGGVLVIGGSTPDIGNNTIACNNKGVSWGGYGITSSASFPVIEDNNISHNGGEGISIYYGKAAILRNLALGNTVQPHTQGTGIDLRNADAFIYRNNCSGNTIGLHLYRGNSTVMENVFNDNVGDTIVVGDGYGVEDSSNSTFVNNSYSGNQCGICLNGCTSTFRNETINSSRRGGVEYYEQSRPFSALMTNCSFSKNALDVKLQRLFGGGQGGSLDLINPAASNLAVSVTEPLATLKVSWYLQVCVVFENGSRPAADAQVNLTDAYGARAATLVSGGDGRTDRMLLEAYTKTGGMSSIKTPFNISACCEGRSNFTADFSLASSQNATIILDDIAPVVRITSPANRTLTSRREITVTGVSEWNVSLRVDGQQVIIGSNGVWSVDVPLQNEGANGIRAEAVDGGLNRATDAITVFRDTVAPELDIRSPVDGLLTNRTRVLVAGTVSDPSASVTLNGQDVPVAPDGAFSLEAVLVEGANALKLESRDAAGNRAGSSMTVYLDGIPPLLAVLRPQSGLLTSQASVTVTGSTDPDCELWMNGVLVALGGGPFTVEAGLHEGVNILIFSARDAAGNENLSRITVIRDSTPPVLELASPVEGLVLNATTVEVRGMSEAGAFLTLNGNPVTPDGNAFSVLLILLEGLNTITVEASDALENTARSTVTVFVDTKAPSLTIKSPPDGRLTCKTAIEVRGFTEPGVYLTVNEIPAPVDAASGAFNCTVGVGREGANRVSVRATDAANNTAIAEVTIIRDTLVRYNITSPVDGESTKEATVVIRGGTEPGGSIMIRGIPVYPSQDGAFSQAVSLKYGPNLINITVTDPAGNSITRTLEITRLEPSAPVPAKGFIPGFTTAAAVAAAVSAIVAAGWLRRRKER